MNRPDLNKLAKAITIKQTWAYLICAGIKDVENRTWKTKFRGRVYIHASATKIKDHWSLLTQDQYNSAMNCFLDLELNSRFELSAIIGHVDIVNCISKARDGKGSDSIWAEPDYFHWILRNPVLYEKPILNVKGKLSFWDYSEHTQDL